MKKLALTSLLAVFAVSGAHAANVIDGNPLYLPGQNHFYSVSTLGSHSDHFKTWGMNEDFGYGITDRLAINVSTTIVDEQSFDQWSWNEMSFGAKLRVIDMGGWKGDLVGAYAVNPFWGNHQSWLDKDVTTYTWTAGVRGGYVGSWWTVAGHALFNYEGAESFDWDEDGIHTLALGVDGQLVLGRHFSLLAGVEYTGVMDSAYPWGEPVKNEGKWSAEFGANYNFDATKFIGLYVNTAMHHHGGAAADEWKVEDGFGYGVKFGIDF
ncbi:MAG: hypothetical protein IK122_03890 [Alphaproteobacteria bacterium]|nr:hypothetical protein [Alphaproteobacteria bacterium]